MKPNDLQRFGNAAVFARRDDRAPEDSWWLDADRFYELAKKNQGRMSSSKFGVTLLLNRDGIEPC